jgi:hypothetical protein
LADPYRKIQRPFFLSSLKTPRVTPSIPDVDVVETFQLSRQTVLIDIRFTSQFQAKPVSRSVKLEGFPGFKAKKGVDLIQSGLIIKEWGGMGTPNNTPPYLPSLAHELQNFSIKGFHSVDIDCQV